MSNILTSFVYEYLPENKNSNNIIFKYSDEGL